MWALFSIVSVPENSRTRREKKDDSTAAVIAAFPRLFKRQGSEQKRLCELKSKPSNSASQSKTKASGSGRNDTGPTNKKNVKPKKEKSNRPYDPVHVPEDTTSSDNLRQRPRRRATLHTQSRNFYKDDEDRNKSRAAKVTVPEKMTSSGIVKRARRCSVRLMKI